MDQPFWSQLVPKQIAIIDTPDIYGSPAIQTSASHQSVLCVLFQVIHHHLREASVQKFPRKTSEYTAPETENHRP